MNDRDQARADGPKPEVVDDETSVRAAIDAQGQTSGSVVAAQSDQAKVVSVVEAIERVSRAIYHARSPEELHDRLVDELMATYPASDSCHVLGWDEASGRLTPRASRSSRGKTASQPRFSKTITQRALDQKQALLCVDVQSDEDLASASSIQVLGVRSFVCAPMLREGRALGLIYLGSRGYKSPFSEDDLRFLSVIGHEAALALDNMALMKQSVEMELALKMAREVQVQALPDAPPALPGFDLAGVCVPSNTVSGDYYDCVEMQDGRCGVAVGDVSGHGLASALLMMAARSLLRALAAAQADTAQIMVDMNRLLTADIKDDMWMSMVFAAVEPSADTLAYFSAGHEPGVVYRASTKMIENLPSTTCPIGVLPDLPATPAEKVDLAAGDVLLLCTDGIAETRDAQDELYGRDRLNAALSAHAPESADAIVQSLLSEIDEFRGRVPRGDDVTIVVVKKTG